MGCGLASEPTQGLFGQQGSRKVGLGVSSTWCKGPGKPCGGQQSLKGVAQTLIAPLTAGKGYLAIVNADEWRRRGPQSWHCLIL